MSNQNTTKPKQLLKLTPIQLTRVKAIQFMENVIERVPDDDPNFTNFGMIFDQVMPELKNKGVSDDVLFKVRKMISDKNSWVAVMVFLQFIMNSVEETSKAYKQENEK